PPHAHPSFPTRRSSDLINAIAGAAVDGMLVTLPADFTQDPANAEIVKAFTDKNRDPGGAFQLTAFAATKAIAEGIKGAGADDPRSEEHTSELQSRENLV